MKYYGHLGGVERDELFAGPEEITATRNVEVASDAAIVRGMVLASEKTYGTYHLATASDTSAVLVIARENFDADSNCNVVTAYSSGKFTKQRLIVAEGADIDDFVEPLRKVDIHVVPMKLVASN